MNIAKEYLDKQMENPLFKETYEKEKRKLDLEYKLNELENNIKNHISEEIIISEIEIIKKLISSL